MLNDEILFKDFSVIDVDSSGKYKIIYKRNTARSTFLQKKGRGYLHYNGDKLMSLEQFRKIADPKEISSELLGDKVINKIISSFEY